MNDNLDETSIQNALHFTSDQKWTLLLCDKIFKSPAKMLLIFKILYAFSIYCKIKPNMSLIFEHNFIH